MRLYVVSPVVSHTILKFQTPIFRFNSFISNQGIV